MRALPLFILFAGFACATAQAEDRASDAALRRAQVAHLRGKAVLGIEVEMGAGLALPGAIRADVDEHAVLPLLAWMCVEIFRP